MRRTLGLVVVALVVLGLGLVGTAAADGSTPDCTDVEYSGDGNSENPYEITDADELQCLGDGATNSNLDDHFELQNDIDLSDAGVEDWNDGDGFEPIGECNEAPGCDPDEGASPFSGTFDGNDTEISGLVINSENPENGLFGAAGGATIENVRLHDIDIDIDTADDFPQTGGIVGMMTDSELTRSSVTGEIVSAQDSTTGVGGLVGENWGGTIEQSYANTTVTGGDDQYVGGLVGLNFDDTLFHGKGSISDSYATGDVSGGADDFGTGVGTGGLVGVNSGDISNSYATGDVDADENVGGLVGSNSGDITSSYWDEQAATVTEDGEAQDGQGVGDGGGNVAGLTTSEMTGDRAEDNMAFDFADTWAVVDEPEDGNEVSYPFLQTATQEPAPGLQSRFADGNGSADDPFVIEDWEHLDNVRANLAANFTLGADLDEQTDGYGGDGEDGVVLDADGELRDGGNPDGENAHGFEPIGNDDDEFTGTFDGDDRTITGLRIEGDYVDDHGVGLFGNTEESYIEHLSLEDVEIKSMRSDPDHYWRGEFAGGLAGRHDGTIEGVSVTGTVSGYEYVGGVVGVNGGELLNDEPQGAIYNSSADVTVIADTKADVDDVGLRIGGLAGRSGVGSEVHNSSAAGDVIGDEMGEGIAIAGGLIGGDFGNLTESFATGDVTGGEDMVGGLVGETDDEMVLDSYATGNVTGERRVGGLIGNNDADVVRNSYATGDVTGEEQVGGLIARDTGDYVEKSYATGDVTGEERVGGLIGNNDADVVRNSYATGNVTGDEHVGGLFGESHNEVADTYWDRGTTTQADAIGWNRGTSSGLVGFGDTADADPAPEMTGLDAPGNLTAFDFPNGDGDWHVTDGYPALAWEDTGPFFEVTIQETNAPIEEGDTLDVTTEVTNWAADGEQTVELLDFEDDQQATADVSLTSGDATEVTLEWETETSDAGTDNVTVASENDIDSVEVTIESRSASGGGSSSPTAAVDSDETTSTRIVGDELQAEVTPSAKDGVSESHLGFSDVRSVDLEFTAEDARGEQQATATLDRLEMVFTERTSTAVTIRESSDPTSESARQLDGGLEAASYLQIATDIDADQFESATVEFSISTDALETPDDETNQVSLYHFDSDADEWHQLETALIAESDDEQRFSADIDRISQFAIGVGTPDTGSDDSDTPKGDDDETDDGDDGSTHTEPEDDTGDGTPGFSVGISLVAIGILLLAGRQFGSRE